MSPVTTRSSTDPGRHSCCTSSRVRMDVTCTSHSLFFGDTRLDNFSGPTNNGVILDRIGLVTSEGTDVNHSLTEVLGVVAPGTRIRLLHVRLTNRSSTVSPSRYSNDDDVRATPTLTVVVSGRCCFPVSSGMVCKIFRIQMRPVKLEPVSSTGEPWRDSKVREWSTHSPVVSRYNALSYFPSKGWGPLSSFRSDCGSSRFVSSRTERPAHPSPSVPRVTIADRPPPRCQRSHEHDTFLREFCNPAGRR